MVRDIVSSQIIEALEEKGKSNAYKLNNLLWWGKFITNEEYNINHHYIKHYDIKN